jgi:hypothetical protein
MLRRFIFRALHDCGVIYPKAFVQALLDTRKIAPRTTEHPTIRPLHINTSTMWSGPIAEPYDSADPIDDDEHSGGSVPTTVTDADIDDLVLVDDLVSGLLTKEPVKLTEPPYADLYDAALAKAETKVTKMRVLLDTVDRSKVELRNKIKAQIATVMDDFDAEWPEPV